MIFKMINIFYVSHQRAYPMTVITEQQSFFWSMYTIFSRPALWFCLGLTAVTAIIPDIIIKLTENSINAWKMLKEENFEKKIKSKAFNDVPEHWKEQERKRSELRLKKVTRSSTKLKQPSFFCASYRSCTKNQTVYDLNFVSTNDVPPQNLYHF